jgi:undecaprenyl-diphosphatase
MSTDPHASTGPTPDRSRCAAAAIPAAAFLILALIVRAGYTQAFDEAVLHWFAAHRAAWLDAAMMRITLLGNFIVWAMVTLNALVLLRLTGHRALAKVVLIAAVGVEFVVNGLKMLWGRPRPDVVEWIDHVRTFSFPSGHATTSLVIYGVLLWAMLRLASGTAARRALLAGATLLVLLIAVSRMYLGVHYPTDILGGWLAGGAWLMLVLACFATRSRAALRTRP